MKHLRLLAAVAFIALSVGGIASPAQAQVPALPSQLTPVLEVLGPTVSPVCNNVGSAFALAPVVYSSIVGSPLPSELLTLIGPVIVVCGSLPIPKPGQKIVCDPDLTVRDIIGKVGSAAGSSVGVELPLFAALASTTVIIENKLPAPANTLGLGALAQSTLKCKTVVPVKAPAINTGTSDDAPVADDNLDDDSAIMGDYAIAPDNGLDPLGLGDTATGNLDDVLNSEGGASSPRLVASGTGFAYPVVFALPLVIIVLGGFLGRALTQPVSASRPTRG